MKENNLKPIENFCESEYINPNFPYVENEFDAATTYQQISKLHGDFDETLDELNTRLIEVDQDIEDIKEYVDTQMISKEYVDKKDIEILKQAKEYTDQNSSFNVTIEKDGFGNYIADYNDNDINNARNSGKVVQAKYYDNEKNQTYTYYYSTMQSDRRPTFIRTYNEDNKVIQVLASVDYDKKVEVLRKIVDVDKLIEPVNNEVDLLTGEMSDVKQDILTREKFATVKESEASDIVSVETFRTHFYNLRKNESRKYQFEVEPGNNENIVAGVGGLPNGEDLKDKGFIYVEIPFSEAGGFIIDITYENRSKNKLYNKKDYSTLNSNWKSTGWYEVGTDSNLRSQIASNTKRIKTLEQNIFDNGVAEGEFINIKDSALAEQQEVMLGVNKAQITTKGVNKLKYFEQSKTKQGVTVDFKKDKIIINGTPEAEPVYVDTTISKELIITTELNTNIFVKKNDNSPVTVRIEKGNFGGNAFFISSYNDTNVNNEKINVSENTTVTGLTIQLTKGYQYTNSEIQLMITDATEENYEPYTGGIASPNPNYKQEINKLTGSVEYTSCGKNLIGTNKDINITKGNVTLKVEDDVYTLNGTTGGNEFIDFNVLNDLKIKLNHKYSIKIFYISGNSNKQSYVWLHNGKSGQGMISNFFENKDTIKTSFPTDEILDENYIRIKPNAILENYKFKILTYEGEEPTPYTPYQAISNTIDLKGNEVLPGDKIRLRFNPMTGKYEKILQKNSKKVILTGNENWGRSSTKLPVFSIQFNDKKSGNSNFYCNQFSYLGNAQFEKLGYAMSWNVEIFKDYMYVQVPPEIVQPEDYTGFKNWFKNKFTKDNPCELIYELADEFKQEINLGEIDIMNMTYYPTTNAFTDKENVLINMKYYRDFTNTIKNIQIDVNNIPTKTSQLTNDSGFVTANEIKKMQVVTELPAVEEPNVLYLVQEGVSNAQIE